jgi:hypothetical protein
MSKAGAPAKRPTDRDLARRYKRSRLIVDEVRLRRAFEALPCPYTDDLPPESREVMLDSMCERYLYLARPDPAALSPSNRESHRSLDRIAKQAGDLFASLARLPGNDAQAIHAKLATPPTVGQIETFLLNLGTAAAAARDAIERVDPKGPRPKLQALEIACAAAGDFSELTHRAPTRIGGSGRNTGDFIVFLRDIFAALGIVASAERCAEKAIRHWKARRGAVPQVLRTMHE